MGWGSILGGVAYEAFSHAVPDVVDVDVGGRALELSGHPNAEDADVDYSDIDADEPFHVADAVLVWDEQTDAVDDDLEDYLDLDDPEY